LYFGESEQREQQQMVTSRQNLDILGLVICTNQNGPFKAGVGNSFNFAGNIRDLLGICEAVHVL